MKKLIVLAGILVLLGGISIEGMAQTHNSAMDPFGFTQTVRKPWTIDVHKYLKDVANLTVRDTIYADTLISDSIDVHLLFDAPYFICTVDTTGLGSSPTNDTLFWEIRRQYWDKGKWDFWAGLDTIWSGAQVGDTLHKSNALWGSSDITPWAVQVQCFSRSAASRDTTRAPIVRIVGQ